MEKTRENLSKILRQILGSDNTYFQPPNGVSIKYPCIIYKLEDDDEVRADDKVYLHRPRWTLNVIDYDPDSKLYRILMDEFDHCSLDRMAVNNNLNHWYMTLYW